MGEKKPARPGPTTVGGAPCTGMGFSNADSSVQDLASLLVSEDAQIKFTISFFVILSLDFCYWCKILCSYLNYRVKTRLYSLNINYLGSFVQPFSLYPLISSSCHLPYPPYSAGQKGILYLYLAKNSFNKEFCNH